MAINAIKNFNGPLESELNCAMAIKATRKTSIGH
jgi:hypothetical protein